MLAPIGGPVCEQYRGLRFRRLFKEFKGFVDTAVSAHIEKLHIRDASLCRRKQVQSFTALAARHPLRTSQKEPLGLALGADS